MSKAKAIELFNKAKKINMLEKEMYKIEIDFTNKKLKERPDIEFPGLEFHIEIYKMKKPYMDKIEKLYNAFDEFADKLNFGCQEYDDHCLDINGFAIVLKFIFDIDGELY